MKEFGIDLSKWNGNFDFQKAISEGVGFVLLRGAYHATKDTKFEDYYSSAKSKNLPVGVYQYCMATSEDEARKEAEFLYQNCLKGKQFELPIYYDMEDNSIKKLGKAKLTSIAKAWCEYLEAKNFFVGIYAASSFFDSYLNDSELKSYAHWVAQWSINCTHAGGLWQFGGEKNFIRPNKVAGKTTDQDYMFVDYPSMIKEKGCNGFSKSKEKPFPDLGKGVLKSGSKGEQVKNLQTVLTGLKYDCGKVDGVYGSKTTAAVKAAQKANKCAVDGVCGNKTKAALKAAY